MSSISDKYDLIVAGAGPAGTAAAIAAARGGCRVLCIERHGFAGGMATAGLVNPFLGHYYKNPETGKTGTIIKGIFQEIWDRLNARNALKRFYYNGPDSVFSDAFDDRWLQIVYDEMFREAGVDVLYNAQIADAEVSGSHIESVTVLGKQGQFSCSAKGFIDSTGDADLASLSGVECEVGRPEDGLCQPCSVMFRVGGIDKEKLCADGLNAARKKVGSFFQDAVEKGRIEFPFKSWLAFYEYPCDSVLHFNATRIQGKPALTSEELTRAEIEGRRQAAVLCDWLKAEVPCFEQSFLASLPAQAGVRETRRIKGRYMMDRDDILEGARFEDGIARSAYFIDIHPPSGSEKTKKRKGSVRDDRNVSPSRYYEIPLRSLQPENIDNLLVACRALSATHEAHGAIRVMATMTAVGEAAGLAAAAALNKEIVLGEVNGIDVRSSIGYLDTPLEF